MHRRQCFFSIHRRVNGVFGVLPVGILRVAESGPLPSAGQFQQTNNCPATLAGGQTCTCSVVFAPVSGGNRTGSLQFTLSGAKVKPVALSGTAVVVAVNPTYVNLDAERISGSVTVTNPCNSSGTLVDFA